MRFTMTSCVRNNSSSSSSSSRKPTAYLYWRMWTSYDVSLCLLMPSAWLTLVASVNTVNNSLFTTYFGKYADVLRLTSAYVSDVNCAVYSLKTSYVTTAWFSWYTVHNMTHGHTSRVSNSKWAGSLMGRWRFSACVSAWCFAAAKCYNVITSYFIFQCVICGYVMFLRHTLFIVCDGETLYKRRLRSGRDKNNWKKTVTETEKMLALS